MGGREEGGSKGRGKVFVVCAAVRCSPLTWLTLLTLFVYHILLLIGALSFVRYTVVSVTIVVLG